MPPAWILACLLSVVCIQAVEYANRISASPTFFATLRFTWPLILVAQWGLWATWRGAPHYLAAWLAFTLANCAARLFVSRYFAGETFAWWGLLGVTAMMGGAFVVKEALNYGGK